MIREMISGMAKRVSVVVLAGALERVVVEDDEVSC